MNIELSDAEAAVLREVFEQEFRDLKEQTYKAEDTDFKKALHDRRAVLEAILDRLGSKIAG